MTRRSRRSRGRRTSKAVDAPGCLDEREAEGECDARTGGLRRNRRGEGASSSNDHGSDGDEKPADESLRGLDCFDHFAPPVQNLIGADWRHKACARHIPVPVRFGRKFSTRPNLAAKTSL
jgi:hypothetical protein